MTRTIAVETPDREINKATALAVETLRHNVSEKWGQVCPTVAPAWSKTYPAWIHPYDNFWMGKVTPYLFPKEQAAWPVILFSKYQAPCGMIGWGVHDCESPEATQAKMAVWTPEQQAEHERSSRYIRDHLFIMQARDLWFATGDTDLLHQLYPHCLRALDYLAAYRDADKDGLIESADIIEDISIGTFDDQGSPKAVERAIEQIALYGALRDMVAMAVALDDTATAQKVAAQAEELKRACNALFWDERGFFRFAIDAGTHEPVHGEHTSTWANGYAILWGMVDDARAEKILDYLESWDVVVPGPILIPPLNLAMSHALSDVHLPPGVYANGGCGWGRGIMPSVCLASFRQGRLATGFRYLHDQAAAANQAGAFYEYWNWEKYVGNSAPGGCRDYSETASGFLDALVHGLFGVQPTQPGYTALTLAPRFPQDWSQAHLSLSLPDGGQLRYEEQRTASERAITIVPDGRRELCLSLAVEKPPIAVTLDGQPVAFASYSRKPLHLIELTWTTDRESVVNVRWGA